MTTLQKKYKFTSLKNHMDSYLQSNKVASIPSVMTLLNDEQAEKYLNPSFARQSMPDINYDILSYFMLKEGQLIRQNKLKEDNYFFIALNKKINDNSFPASRIIDQEFRLAMTLGYLEYFPRVHEHWNFWVQLSQDKKNNIIATEITSQGIKGYSNLKKHINLDELKAFTIEHGKHTYNLTEHVLTEAVFSDWRHIDKFLFQTTLTCELNQLIDYIKLLNNWSIKKIQTFKLDLINDPVLNEQIIDYKINPDTTIHDTLYNISKYNQMCINMEKCFLQFTGKETCFQAYGLDLKTYTNPTELLSHYAQDSFVQPLIRSFILNKSKNATHNENKSFWNYLLLDYNTPVHQVVNTKINKI